MIIISHTRQIVETSTQITSIAHTEIRRSGINELYPPVGQLAVAAAEAAAAAAAASSAALLLAAAFSACAHGDEVGDADEDDVVEVDEQRRAVM